jgi:uncharacterized protein (TIGR00369 family)
MAAGANASPGSPFNPDPMHAALGIRLEEQRPGFARLTLSPPGGFPAGPALIAVLVDAAVFQAILPTLGPDEGPGGTSDLNLSFFEDLPAGPFSAEATVIKKGRQLVVVEVPVFDNRGQLAATARATQVVRQRLAP